MVEGLRRKGVKKSVALCATAVCMFAFSVSTQAGAETTDSCITCHSNPNFAAFNKKIRNYYLKWENSNHSYAGVTCYDCHGGNPEESDKNKAHADRKSSIYFTDIPKTCGKCHQSNYDSFVTSPHYKYLETPDALNMHGANCITCHTPGESFMGMGANPENVEKACELCHNYKTRNFPEVPEKAMGILVKFNSIKQQFHNLMISSDIAPAQDFVETTRKDIKELSVAWHSFNLNEAEKKTDSILAMMKAERKILRKMKTDAIFKSKSNETLYGN